ncbi:hypothetical protein [Breoghania sp.]|uniref:hypothetical protein n=1 Tax=Breoghania sp. TaxID=2065378 RepID=UPI00260A8F11|nr:hypothetical protein [Breoghania sp.]MDJ0931590.1 hypothetical protein [Breoghania sp.]
MTWSLDFAPLVPVWLIVILSSIAVILMALALWRRQRGTIIRSCAFAALILALLNPAVEREEREPLSSVVALVADRSQSQDLDGRREMTDQVVDALRARLEALPNLEVRTIDAGRARSDLQNDGTALFGVLSQELSDVPPDRIAGAIMVTDGQVHDIPDNTAALGFDAPLHALITGHENERDRRIVVIRAPRFGLVGKEQQVRLRMSQAGKNIDQTPARLVVRRDGEEIDSLTIPPEETVDVPVEIAHGGQNIFEFEVQALDGELTTLNNRAVITIDGVRENLRVLLVSGEPHAGERTWRNLLKSDAAVDLVHFTILRPPEKQDGTPISQLSLIAFPTRELFSVKIDEFDLIIFDRYKRRRVLPILYFDNIARYVRDGGALLVATGPDYAEAGSLYRTPLATVMPAEPSGRILEGPFLPRISALGERHPVTRGLPGSGGKTLDWSHWFRLIDTVDHQGEVVMTGPEDKPLLILDRKNKGRVALLLSDQVWLWARGYEGGGPHVELLRRLAHWLMKEPDLEEEALRASTRGHELTVERQTLGESVDPVEVTGPTGETQTLTLKQAEPGLWRATISTDDIGLYSVSDGERTALANIGPANPREFADVLSTTAALSAIAHETGGDVRRLARNGGEPTIPRIVTLNRASSYAGSGWIGLKTTDASILKGIDRLPLFIGFLGLAILLDLLSATWYREGH